MNAQGPTPHPPPGTPPVPPSDPSRRPPITEPPPPIPIPRPEPPPAPVGDPAGDCPLKPLAHAARTAAHWYWAHRISHGTREGKKLRLGKTPLRKHRTKWAEAVG